MWVDGGCAGTALPFPGRGSSNTTTPASGATTTDVTVSVGPDGMLSFSAVTGPAVVVVASLSASHVEAVLLS